MKSNILWRKCHLEFNKKNKKTYICKMYAVPAFLCFGFIYIKWGLKMCGWVGGKWCFQGSPLSVNMLGLNIWLLWGGHHMIKQNDVSVK